jgi:hypothetical protein
MQADTCKPLQADRLAGIENYAMRLRRPNKAGSTRCGGEGFENAAIRNRAMTALPEKGFQFPAQGSKVRQFPFHVRQMLTGDLVHGLAGLFFLIGKIQQCSNLVDGKTEVAGPSRKGG